LFRCRERVAQRRATARTGNRRRSIQTGHISLPEKGISPWLREDLGDLDLRPLWVAAWADEEFRRRFEKIPASRAHHLSTLTRTRILTSPIVASLMPGAGKRLRP
jgi:hypothetical protein